MPLITNVIHTFIKTTLPLALLISFVTASPLFAQDSERGTHRMPAKLVEDVREATRQFIDVNKESVLRAFAEFQALGMITLADDFSASVNLPDAKAMQEAYEVRAALEEIAGRAAAAMLGGASLLLPPRNSAKGGWPGSESQT